MLPRVMRPLLALLLSSLPALAQPAVRWTAQTWPPPGHVPGDPAVGGSFVLGTDSAHPNLSLYFFDGADAGTVFTTQSRSVDINGSLVAVSEYTSGVISLFSSAGSSFIARGYQALSNPGQVALAETAGTTYLFTETGGLAVERYRLTPEEFSNAFIFERLDPLPVPAVVKGLAYDGTADLLVVSTTQGLVVQPAATSAAPHQPWTVDREDLTEGAEPAGVALARVDNTRYVFVAAPSTQRIFVHRVSLDGSEALGAFALRDANALTVQPVYLAASSTLLVASDELARNYKFVPVGHALSAVLNPDGGASLSDGGSGSGAGGGSGNGGAGTGPNGNGVPAGSAQRRDEGCSAAPLVGLPALLLLWWIRRPRS